MTLPMGPHGDSPLFDPAALAAISGVRQRAVELPRPVLTAAEKREAADVIKAGGLCRFCAGIHAGASTPACPRLASGKVNGDGDVTEFTFWVTWPTDRVVFPEDVEEVDEAAGGEGDDR